MLNLRFSVEKTVYQNGGASDWKLQEAQRDGILYFPVRRTTFSAVLGLHRRSLGLRDNDVIAPR